MLKSLNGLCITVRAATQARVIAVPKINGYNIFMKEAAKETTETISRDTMAQFSKATSIKWKALSSDQKESYFKRSKEMNKKAMEDFHKLSKEKQLELETAAREDKKVLARKRELRARREMREETGYPKRPINAWTLFFKAKLNDNISTEKTSREENNAFLATLAKEWNSMTTAEKYKYTKVAEKNKEVYHAEVAKWKAANDPKKNSAQ